MKLIEKVELLHKITPDDLIDHLKESGFTPFAALKVISDITELHNPNKPIRKRGYIKFFNQEQGFGFIRTADEDYFLHSHNLRHQADIEFLTEDAEVEFTESPILKTDGKSKSAQSVEFISNSQ